ncbi:hypothetical protein WJX84_006103 [Apatococcus fuscideae]
MCALTFQQAKTVKVLKAGGARMTASGTNFTSDWPSSVTWNPASANNKQALAAKMTLDRVAQCQAMWSFVSGKMNSQGAEEKMRQAGVLLFYNLFELEPRLRQLFPFKTGAGHIDDRELEQHGMRVVSTLGHVVQRLSDLDTLMPELTNLCARHIKYGVEMQHYDILATAFLITMETALKLTWTQEHKDAWFSVFGVIGQAAQQVGTPGSRVSEAPRDGKAAPKA